MAINNVNPQQLKQTGRARGVDPQVKDVTITHNANFSAEQSYVYDFAIINNVATFGVMKTLFVDNGAGINDIEITVDDTDQYFTVPDGAQGYFPISASAASKLTIYCLGGAVDIVTVQIMNFEVPPIVWYSYGTNNTNTPLQMQGAMNVGATVAGEGYKRPVFIGAIDNTGIYRAVLCDTSGALQMAGTISIAAISIPDGNDVALGNTADAAVTNPAATASLIALTKGNVYWGAQITTQVTALNTVIGTQGDIVNTNPAFVSSLISYVKGLLSTLNTFSSLSLRRAFTAGLTTVAASVANQTFLTALDARRGATIYNDSASANLYLALSVSAASTTNFTIKIPPYGYYEVPEQYCGQINGIWDAAVGNARISSLTN